MDPLLLFILSFPRALIDGLRYMNQWNFGECLVFFSFFFILVEPSKKISLFPIVSNSDDSVAKAKKERRGVLSSIWTDSFNPHSFVGIRAIDKTLKLKPEWLREVPCIYYCRSNQAGIKTRSLPNASISRSPAVSDPSFILLCMRTARSNSWKAFTTHNFRIERIRAFSWGQVQRWTHSTFKSGKVGCFTYCYGGFMRDRSSCHIRLIPFWLRKNALAFWKPIVFSPGAELFHRLGLDGVEWREVPFVSLFFSLFYSWGVVEELGSSPIAPMWRSPIGQIKERNNIMAQRWIQKGVPSIKKTEKLDLYPTNHTYQEKVFCFGSTSNHIWDSERYKLWKTFPLEQGMSWAPTWKSLPTHKLTQRVCQKASFIKCKQSRQSKSNWKQEYYL